MRGFRFERDFMERLPQARIIAKLTIGYDDVDIERPPISAFSSPIRQQANWGGVAEGTMTMMLTMLKQTRQKDRHVREGGWRDDSLDGVYLGAPGRLREASRSGSSDWDASARACATCSRHGAST